MSDQSKLGLGQIITTPQERDAIHIAVAPVHAAFELYPGQHVGINTDGNAIPAELREGIGIADPFLKTKILPGDRFWLFLYPGSITSLRHQWTHPAFDEATGPIPAPQEPLQKEKEEAERWLRDYCQSNNPYGLDFEQFIREVHCREIYYRGRDLHWISELEDHAELEKNLSAYLGAPITIDGSWSFSCSC